MLLPTADGLLVGKKQTIVETINPTAQEYDSAPIDRARLIFRPQAGMGERQQSSTMDRRYHYALDCWILGGLFGKGPLVCHFKYTSIPQVGEKWLAVVAASNSCRGHDSRWLS